MTALHCAPLVGVVAVPGGWRAKLDGWLPITILEEEWPGPEAQREGERIEFRYGAPEFVQRAKPEAARC